MKVLVHMEESTPMTVLLLDAIMDLNTNNQQLSQEDRLMQNNWDTEDDLQVSDLDHIENDHGKQCFL